MQNPTLCAGQARLIIISSVSRVIARSLLASMGNLRTICTGSLQYLVHMAFRILIRCFLRTQEFFKDIAKQLVNWVETGPIKEKSTNSNFFPHYLEFHMNFFLEFQFFSSIFLEFNMKFFWNSNFFWNFICLEQTGLLISSVYYR